MKTIVVIPDSHDSPEHDQKRYQVLGEYLYHLRPDYVVDLGDFSDVAALCSYERGTLHFEGKRLNEDIKSAVEARRLLTEPLLNYSNQTFNTHRKRYKPRLIALGGNHEARITKLMNTSPELDGLFSQDISNAAGQGWEFHPFGNIVTVENIDFTHYFVSGIMGRPIGGEHAARQLVVKRHRSSVQGHSHVWNMYSHINDMGHETIGVVAGCYVDYFLPYAGQVNNMWYNGITIIRCLVNGRYDVERIHYDRLKELI